MLLYNDRFCYRVIIVVIIFIRIIDFIDNMIKLKELIWKNKVSMIEKLMRFLIVRSLFMDFI